jgi:hypothetical protein
MCALRGTGLLHTRHWFMRSGAVQTVPLFVVWLALPLGVCSAHYSWFRSYARVGLLVLATS